MSDGITHRNSNPEGQWSEEFVIRFLRERGKLVKMRSARSFWPHWNSGAHAHSVPGFILKTWKLKLKWREKSPPCGSHFLYCYQLLHLVTAVLQFFKNVWKIRSLNFIRLSGLLFTSVRIIGSSSSVPEGSISFWYLIVHLRCCLHCRFDYRQIKRHRKSNGWEASFIN